MKKLFYAVVVQLCMVGLVYAETQQPAQKAFPGTTVLRLDKLMPGNEGGLPVQLAYDSSLSTMLNKTVREEGPIVTTRLLSTRIDRKKEQRFFVDFEPGPSNDPVFLISSENGAKPVGSINADQLILPGDGFVYTAARSNQLRRTQKICSARQQIDRGQAAVPVCRPGLDSATAADDFFDQGRRRYHCLDCQRGSPDGRARREELFIDQDAGRSDRVVQTRSSLVHARKQGH